MSEALRYFIACNSGSICSESKLFSYLHDNNLFYKIKGAIAYWVGKGNKFGIFST